MGLPGIAFVEKLRLAVACVTRVTGTVHAVQLERVNVTRVGSTPSGGNSVLCPVRRLASIVQTTVASVRVLGASYSVCVRLDTMVETVT